ncbi:MAG: peptide MFS transporter, partial [Asticcacaulis sp.]
ALLLVAGHFTMAFEGAEPKQVLTYQGTQYEFVTEGRGSTRDVKIEVADKLYSFKPNDDGALVIQGLPEGGQLPTVLPKGSYELSVKDRQPLFENIFFLALSLIVMGVGFLKANISSIVGELYPQGDPRRDSGFTLYYFGINLGSFWAAILCGYLGETVGWWAGFGLAGIGMLAGYIVFVIGKPWLEGKGEPPVPETLKKPLLGPINLEYSIYILGLLGVGLVWLLIQRNEAVGLMLIAASVIVLAYVGFLMATKFNKIERERLFLALILVFGSVVFFTLFEQAGSSLSLFAARNTNLDMMSAPFILNVLGQTIVFASAEQLKAVTLAANSYLWVDMSMTASQTQSFNAGFILIFAPVFAGLWAWLGKINRDINPVMKFGVGLINVGLGFLVLVWAAGLADSAFKLPLIFLALTYLLHTWGELLLSPVGLSQITKLSPPMIVSTMMAVWFLASSWAQYVGGFIAGMTESETVGGQVLDPAKALATSLDVFGMIGWVGVGFGVAYMLISFVIKHWDHGANKTSGSAGH